MTNTIARKMGEMQHQAIIELIQQTGIPFSRDAFKTAVGSQRVLQDLQDAGWTISEVFSDDALKTTYMLQRDGKTVACREVCVHLVMRSPAREDASTEEMFK